jgi:electron transport complex protein RnfB
MKLAIIRAEECVGCAKCIPACPVDAIIGSAKFLHSVLTDECIGCGLCLAPCPMDCIEMVESSIQPGSEEKLERANKAKKRYQNRLQRLQNEQPKMLPIRDPAYKTQIRQEIQAAVLRVKEKRAEGEVIGECKTAL